MLVSALRRFWALVAVVMVVTLVTAGIYASRSESVYTASSVVSVEPRRDATGSAALFTLLSTKYVAFAAGDSLAERLGRQLGVPRSQIQEGLEIRLAERTTNISISMTSSSPDLAVRVAGSISQMVEERAAADASVRAQIVVPASADSLIEQSGRLQAMGSGAIAALALGLLTALGAERSSRGRGRTRSG